MDQKNEVLNGLNEVWRVLVDAGVETRGTGRGAARFERASEFDIFAHRVHGAGMHAVEQGDVTPVIRHLASDMNKAAGDHRSRAAKVDNAATRQAETFAAEKIGECASRAAKVDNAATRQAEIFAAEKIEECARNLRALVTPGRG